jgi:energy-coupling factor transporter ATP-binding protein EcfA2
MPASIRFFDDSNNLNKGFLDFLTGLNTNFNIVAIIGPQGSGKSTFASMLSGNETGDLYGEYIFRPSPREFVEKGASQTTSINVYVTKTRTIVFDCQALNSGHIFELALRSSRREGIKLSQVMKYSEDETHKLLMLLFEVCHTIILGIDWFIDLNIIREIMSADLSYRKLKSGFNTSAVRKINLVVAQLRARSIDFEPEIIAERAKMIKGMFDGTRFDVCGGLSLKKLGFDMFSYAEPTVNYVVFAEIKPRSKHDQTPTIDDSSGLLTIPFHETIKKFSLNLLLLPRPAFHQQTGKLNEREWFQNIATSSWEKLFSSELTSFTRK